MLLESAIAIGITSIGYMILTNDKKPEKVRLSGYRELSSLTGNGVIISEHVRISNKFSNEHVLVCAPCGAGKTRSIIMPSVKAITDSTLIVTDPACEIERECRGIHKNSIIFNPFSNNSIGYDPLVNCKSASEVRKIAQIILTNGQIVAETISKQTSSNHAEWLNMAAPLLSAYMLWNWKFEKYTFDTLIKRLVTGKLSDIGNEIMNSNYEEAKTEFLSFIQVAGAQQTLSCIRNVLNSNLQMFLDESVQKILRKPSIKLDTLRDTPTVLYIQIPEKDSDFFTPLTATFMAQLLDKLIEKKDGLQTYLLLDELCNIGYIPNFCKLLSTCRKLRISITGAIQSLSQLQRVYGDIQSTELKELFKTIVVMGGLKDSAEYVSHMLGEQEVVKDKQRYRKPLMTPDEVRRLNSNRCLILCHNRQPVVDWLYKM